MSNNKKRERGNSYTPPLWHQQPIGHPSLEEKGESCCLGWDARNSHVKSLYSWSISHVREGRMSVDRFCTCRLNLASPSLNADLRAFKNRWPLTKTRLPQPASLLPPLARFLTVLNFFSFLTSLLFVYHGVKFGDLFIYLLLCGVLFMYPCIFCVFFYLLLIWLFVWEKDILELSIWAGEKNLARDGGGKIRIHCITK